MRFAISFSFSVALSFFWIMSFYEMRQSRYQDFTRPYQMWWDYLYVYGCVVTCASTAVGLSSVIGV